MTFEDYVTNLSLEPIRNKISIIYGNRIGVDDFVVNKVKAIFKELNIGFDVCHFDNLPSFYLAETASVIFVISCTPFNSRLRNCYIFALIGLGSDDLKSVLSSLKSKMNDVKSFLFIILSSPQFIPQREDVEVCVFRIILYVVDFF